MLGAEGDGLSRAGARGRRHGRDHPDAARRRLAERRVRDRRGAVGAARAVSAVTSVGPGKIRPCPSKSSVHPPRRVSRKVYRRRRTVVFGLVAAILIAFVYVVGSLVAPVPGDGGRDRARQDARPSPPRSWPGPGSAPARSSRSTIPGVRVARQRRERPDRQHHQDDHGPAWCSRRSRSNGRRSGPEHRVHATRRRASGTRSSARADRGRRSSPGTSLTEKQALEAMLLPVRQQLRDLAGELGVRIARRVSSRRRTTGSRAQGLHRHARRRRERARPGQRQHDQGPRSRIGKLVLADPGAVVDRRRQKNGDAPGRRDAGQHQQAARRRRASTASRPATPTRPATACCSRPRSPVGSSKVRVLGVVLGAPTHDDLWAARAGAAHQRAERLPRGRRRHEGQVVRHLHDRVGRRVEARRDRDEDLPGLVGHARSPVDLQTRPLSARHSPATSSARARSR